MSLRVRKGDLVGVQGRAWVSRAIRWATRQKWEPKSLVNHHAIVVNDGPLQDAEIVEATGKVRRGRLLDFYGGKPAKVEVWRVLNVTVEERDIIAGVAETLVGKRYPYHHLLWQFVDERLLNGRYWVRRLATLDPFFICTPLAVSCYWAVGKKFGFKNPHQANPDNLRDFLEANPDKYFLALPLVNLEV